MYEHECTSLEGQLRKSLLLNDRDLELEVGAIYYNIYILYNIYVYIYLFIYYIYSGNCGAILRSLLVELNN